MRTPFRPPEYSAIPPAEVNATVSRLGVGTVAAALDDSIQHDDQYQADYFDQIYNQPDE